MRGSKLTYKTRAPYYVLLITCSLHSPSSVLLIAFSFLRPPYYVLGNRSCNKWLQCTKGIKVCRCIHWAWGTCRLFPLLIEDSMLQKRGLVSTSLEGFFFFFFQFYVAWVCGYEGKCGLVGLRWVHVSLSTSLWINFLCVCMCENSYCYQGLLP